MKKLSKILVALSLVLSVMIAPMNQVVAAEGEEVIVDGSYLTEDIESTCIVYSPLRGYYIASGSGTITMPSAGKVGAGGSTTAYVAVSSIAVAVSVERYNGSSWVGYYSWTASNSNAYSVSTSKTISVTSKYYYRVSTVHSAGGEVISAYTNGIYVI